MSEDITYCANEKCINTKCERHPINIKLHWLHHSYAMFSACEYFNERVSVRNEPNKEEQEVIEEARREAMRLDDNEDTLKWKGTH